VIILSYKPSHDGAVALIENEQLVLSVEGEKDSNLRHAEVSASTMFSVLSHIQIFPNVVAESGWDGIAAGYYGTDSSGVICQEQNWLGRSVSYFSSSHERSHLMCAYGMSPFAQGEPCYALVWEGLIGSFYIIDKNAHIVSVFPILLGPGYRYAFSFFLANDSRRDLFTGDLDLAGKIMALAAYGNPEDLDESAISTADNILKMPVQDPLRPSMNLIIDKRWFAQSKIYNAGITSQAFQNFAKYIGDAIFEKFYRFAASHLTERFPLLISGGCGLNCEWNTKWKNCGLFPQVFVPPCCNDSGSAIGTAIDAQFHLTGNAKIKWSVNCGKEFIDNVDISEGFSIQDFQPFAVAELLRNGAILGWVNGCYEIGPRALGFRSILASPLTAQTRDRLNKIKLREEYRPIAPICLEEDKALLGLEFDSPFMLFFAKVNTFALPAITHIDGTARPQTLSRSQNESLYQVLTAFKSLTGFGVLCNTSLNFNGYGFINRTSDLVSFVKSRNIDGFVVNNRLYISNNYQVCKQ